jgi:hypothetical protein
VVCEGQRITVFYNGEQRWSCGRCRLSRGEIGLWAEGGDAYFRNIEIRGLPPAPPAPPATDAPNPAAVQPLRDLVAAKERIRNTVQTRVEAGSAARPELVAAEIDLIEARIRLAEAEGDRAAVVARLEELVTLRQEERYLTGLLVEAGREPADALNRADARLADAKARLARVRVDPPLPVAPPPRPKP